MAFITYILINICYVYHSFYFIVDGMCEYHAFGLRYRFVNTRRGQNNAENECATHDGYIVEVASTEEDEFVFEVLVGKYYFEYFQLIHTIFLLSNHGQMQLHIDKFSTTYL